MCCICPCPSIDDHSTVGVSVLIVRHSAWMLHTFRHAAVASASVGCARTRARDESEPDSRKPRAAAAAAAIPAAFTVEERKPKRRERRRKRGNEGAAIAKERREKGGRGKHGS